MQGGTVSDRQRNVLASEVFPLQILTRWNRARIFFDASLPHAKLETRRSRLARSTSKLRKVFDSNTQQFPNYYLTSQDRELESSILDTGKLAKKYSLDPPFLVPAIVDALRSSRYHDITHLVPAEADTFCAGYAMKHGGVVLTSDSDLLVFPIERGQVAFFRDIRYCHGSGVQYVSYSSLKICHQLGLESHDSPMRLAYERMLSPRLALSQLVKNCAGNVSDASGYQAFCRAYPHHIYPGDAKASCQYESHMTLWDPRVSEFILGFHKHCESGRPDEAVNMFLPFLIEHPYRKSAWEESSIIRELAYSVLTWDSTSENPVVIREYRHLQSASHRGRQAHVLTYQAGAAVIQNILTAVSLIESICIRSDDKFWIYVCLILDALACNTEAGSARLRMRVQETQSASSLSWEAVHLVANLQARLYSLRILHQVLSVCVKPLLRNAVSGVENLQTILSLLPCLPQYPDISSLKDAMQDALFPAFLQCLDRLSEGQSEALREAIEEKPRAASFVTRNLGKEGYLTRNYFDLLDMDQGNN